MDEIPESSGLDVAAIGHRMQQAVEASKLSATEFAKQLGVPYSTFRAYTGGRRAPGAELLAALFEVHGLMPSWILTGAGPRKLHGASDSNLDDAFVVIERYKDVRLSAGPGANNPEHGEVTGLCFSRSWLRKRGLNYANLMVADVGGNSMFPRLRDGDTVVLDKSETAPRSGFAYAIRQGDELLVKYAQLLPEGVLRLTSENSQSFPPYDIDLSKTTDVSILGRVVASTHEW